MISSSWLPTPEKLFHPPRQCYHHEEMTTTEGAPSDRSDDDESCLLAPIVVQPKPSLSSGRPQTSFLASSMSRPTALWERCSRLDPVDEGKKKETRRMMGDLTNTECEGDGFFQQRSSSGVVEEDLTARVQQLEFLVGKLMKELPAVEKEKMCVIPIGEVKRRRLFQLCTVIDLTICSSFTSPSEMKGSPRLSVLCPPHSLPVSREDINGKEQRKGPSRHDDFFSSYNTTNRKNSAWRRPEIRLFNREQKMREHVPLVSNILSSTCRTAHQKWSPSLGDRGHPPPPTGMARRLSSSSSLARQVEEEIEEGSREEVPSLYRRSQSLTPGVQFTHPNRKSHTIYHKKIAHRQLNENHLPRNPKQEESTAAYCASSKIEKDHHAYSKDGLVWKPDNSHLGRLRKLSQLSSSTSGAERSISADVFYKQRYHK